MITHHLQTFQFSRSVSDFDCVGILEIFFLIYIFFFKFKNLNFFFEFFFFFIILKRFFFPLKKFCVCVCVLPCDVIGQWRKKKFQKKFKNFCEKKWYYRTSVSGGGLDLVSVVCVLHVSVFVFNLRYMVCIATTINTFKCRRRHLI